MASLCLVRCALTTQTLYVQAAAAVEPHKDRYLFLSFDVSRNIHNRVRIIRFAQFLNSLNWHLEKTMLLPVTTYTIRFHHFSPIIDFSLSHKNERKKGPRPNAYQPSYSSLCIVRQINISSHDLSNMLLEKYSIHLFGIHSYFSPFRPFPDEWINDRVPQTMKLIGYYMEKACEKKNAKSVHTFLTFSICFSFVPKLKSMRRDSYK